MFSSLCRKGVPSRDRQEAVFCHGLFKFGLLVSLLCPAAYSQQRITNHNAHGWYTYQGDHPFGKSRWGFSVDAHYRRHDVITRWQQLLVRPGISYRVNSLLTLTSGYGYISTSRYGEFPVPRPTKEHRLWHQAFLRYRTGKANWGSRFMFENRFSNFGAGLGYQFSNRIRLLQNFRLPLRGAYYFAASNELFLHTPPHVFASTYNQNRAYAAIGRKLPKLFRLEVGYLNQNLLQRNGRIFESNHTLRLALFGNASIGR